VAQLKERVPAVEGWFTISDDPALLGSRCTACGFRHMPPTRACLNCHAIDQMQAERLADTPGTVATFTIDHLAFSLSPPVIGVIIDFDGGGRFRCELTDARPDERERRAGHPVADECS